MLLHVKDGLGDFLLRCRLFGRTAAMIPNHQRQQVRQGLERANQLERRITVLDYVQHLIEQRQQLGVVADPQHRTVNGHAEFIEE